MILPSLVALETLYIRLFSARYTIQLFIVYASKHMSAACGFILHAGLYVNTRPGHNWPRLRPAQLRTCLQLGVGGCRKSALLRVLRPGERSNFNLGGVDGEQKGSPLHQTQRFFYRQHGAARNLVATRPILANKTYRQLLGAMGVYLVVSQASPGISPAPSWAQDLQ